MFRKEENPLVVGGLKSLTKGKPLMAVDKAAMIYEGQQWNIQFSQKHSSVSEFSNCKTAKASLMFVAEACSNLFLTKNWPHPLAR